MRKFNLTGDVKSQSPDNAKQQWPSVGSVVTNGAGGGNPRLYLYGAIRITAYMLIVIAACSYVKADKRTDAT
jgi:hypothetical protein